MAVMSREQKWAFRQAENAFKTAQANNKSVDLLATYRHFMNRTPERYQKLARQFSRDVKKRDEEASRRAIETVKLHEAIGAPVDFASCFQAEKSRLST